LRGNRNCLDMALDYTLLRLLKSNNTNINSKLKDFTTLQETYEKIETKLTNISYLQTDNKIMEKLIKELDRLVLEPLSTTPQNVSSKYSKIGDINVTIC